MAKRRGAKDRLLRAIGNEAWGKVNALRRRHKTRWAGLFEVLSDGVNSRFLGEWLAAARLPDKKVVILDRGTMADLLNVWMRNIALNIAENGILNCPTCSTTFPVIHDWNTGVAPEAGHRPLSVDDLEHRPGPAVVIGAGPSLARFKHLELLAASDFDGLVIACDRVLAPALEAGVRVDIVVSVDGSVKIADMYRDGTGAARACVEDAARRGLIAVMATSIHPATYRAFPGKKYLFHPYLDNPDTTYRSYSQLIRLLTPHCVMMTYGNAGSFAWTLAAYLRRAPIALVGMDMGWHVDQVLAETPYYNTYRALGNSHEYVIKNLFLRRRNTDFDIEYITDYVFDSYGKTMKTALRAAPDVQTYNCTGGGALHGPGIAAMPFEEFLRRHGPAARALAKVPEPPREAVA